MKRIGIRKRLQSGGFSNGNQGICGGMDVAAVARSIEVRRNCIRGTVPEQPAIVRAPAAFTESRALSNLFQSTRGQIVRYVAPVSAGGNCPYHLFVEVAQLSGIVGLQPSHHAS